MKLRLERQVALPDRVVVVDLDEALAIEAQVAWRKGAEAGLKRTGRFPLRGLTPSRLTPARDAWIRAGGR